MRALTLDFSNRDSGLLGLATALIWFATWCFTIAPGVYGFDAHGAAGVGVVALIRFLPAALVSPLVGLLIDRFPRRSVMLGSAVAATLVLAGAATAALGAPTGTIETTSATFAFEASEAATFECRIDSNDPGAWSACTSPRTYGSHLFEVRAADALGHVDPTPASAAFSIYTGPPKPVAGKTFDLEPVEGTIELQCPGESSQSPLTGFKQVPMGCLINTRHGVVNLTASKGSSEELQSSHFWGGVFVAIQDGGDNQTVGLKLAGRRMCERRGGSKAPTARISRGDKHGRRLWGSGKGNYTTSGSYGSATVRGTTWLVVDRCDSSTLIKARRLAALLAGASLLLASAPPAMAGEQLSIPAARERAAAFAASTCKHDASCHNAGVQNCRRLADRVALCRVFDHRKTDEQGNFLCTRLVRLALQPPKPGVRVTGVSDWTC